MVKKTLKEIKLIFDDGFEITIDNLDDIRKVAELIVTVLQQYQDVSG